MSDQRTFIYGAGASRWLAVTLPVGQVPMGVIGKHLLLGDPRAVLQQIYDQLASKPENRPAAQLRIANHLETSQQRVSALLNPETEIRPHWYPKIVRAYYELGPGAQVMDSVQKTVTV